MKKITRTEKGRIKNAYLGANIKVYKIRNSIKNFLLIKINKQRISNNHQMAFVSFEVYVVLASFSLHVNIDFLMTCHYTADHTHSKRIEMCFYVHPSILRNSKSFIVLI